MSQVSLSYLRFLDCSHHSLRLVNFLMQGRAGLGKSHSEGRFLGLACWRTSRTQSRSRYTQDWWLRAGLQHPGCRSISWAFLCSCCTTRGFFWDNIHRGCLHFGLPSFGWLSSFQRKKLMTMINTLFQNPGLFFASFCCLMIRKYLPYVKWADGLAVSCGNTYQYSSAIKH